MALEDLELAARVAEAGVERTSAGIDFPAAFLNPLHWITIPMP